MKGIGLIVLIVSLAIVGALFFKQKKTPVKMTTIAPSGKEVKIEELPTEVKVELDQMAQQAEKRLEDGQNQE